MPIKTPETKNYAFISHRDCEFFPCHQTADPDNFNCLFCYCPLYALGKDCGGNFKMVNGYKDCSDCQVPHKRDNYDYVNRKLGELIEKVKQQGE